METVLFHGIKCDNEKCDFSDETVKVEDYINWLNKPCPKCSSNLLTKHDYDMVLYCISLINKRNIENVNDNSLNKVSFEIILNGTHNYTINEPTIEIGGKNNE